MDRRQVRKDMKRRYGSEVKRLVKSPSRASKTITRLVEAYCAMPEWSDDVKPYRAELGTIHIFFQVRGTDKWVRNSWLITDHLFPLWRFGVITDFTQTPDTLTTVSRHGVTTYKRTDSLRHAGGCVGMSSSLVSECMRSVKALQQRAFSSNAGGYDAVRLPHYVRRYVLLGQQYADGAECDVLLGLCDDYGKVGITGSVNYRARYRSQFPRLTTTTTTRLRALLIEQILKFFIRDLCTPYVSAPWGVSETFVQTEHYKLFLAEYNHLVTLKTDNLIYIWLCR